MDFGRRYRGLPQLAFALALLATSLAAAPAGAQEGDKKRLAVLDLVGQRIEEGIAATLTELVINEASKLDAYQVIGKREIATMLDLETEKQMMGCAEDVSCVAEIAGALGVDEILTGGIGRLGEIYLVSLKLIDQNNAKVVARSQRKLKGGEEMFITAAESMIKEIFQGVKPASEMIGEAAAPAPAAAEPTPAAADAELHAEESSTSLGTVFGWGLLAVAVGAAAGSGALFYLSGEAATDYRDALVADPDDKDQAEMLGYTGWGLVGLAVVAAAGGITLLLLDTGGDEPATASLVPAIGPQGSGLVLQGSW